MRGSFEVAEARPRAFAFSVSYPESPSSSSSASSSSSTALLSASDSRSLSLSLLSLPLSPPGQPFRYSFVSWRLPFASLSLSLSFSASFLLVQLHPFLYPSHRCTQASTFLRSPSIAAKATLCTPHSCGIAPGRASFYNPVPASWGGADLLRCSSTTTPRVYILLLCLPFFTRCSDPRGADSFPGEDSIGRLRTTKGVRERGRGWLRSISIPTIQEMMYFG